MKIISQKLLPLTEGDIAKVIGYDGYFPKGRALSWGTAAIVYHNKLYNGHYDGKYNGMNFSQERFDKEPNKLQGVRPLKYPFFIDQFKNVIGCIYVLEISLKHEDIINLCDPPTTFYDHDGKRFADNLATVFSVNAFYEKDFNLRKYYKTASVTISCHHQLSTAIFNYLKYKQNIWHTGSAICRGDKTMYNECYSKLLEGKIPKLNGLQVYWE
jgi:hypothetical protein